MSEIAFDFQNRYSQKINLRVWSVRQFSRLQNEVLRPAVPLSDEEESRRQFFAKSLEFKISQWRLRSSDAQWRHLTILNLQNSYNAQSRSDWKLEDLRLLCELTSIEELNLSSNCLHADELPLRICQLRNLKTLDLSGNFITHLPYLFLRNNRQLETLYVNNNRLRDLPAYLLTLPHLETIHRLGNSILIHNYNHFHNSLSNRVSISKCDTNHDLSTLSMRVAIAYGTIFSLPYVPPVLSRQMERAASTLYVCDNCSKVVHDEYHQFMLYPSNFRGLTFVPLKAHTCSEHCSKELFEKWDSFCTDSEKEEAVQSTKKVKKRGCILQ